jgi:hypothetical protein
MIRQFSQRVKHINIDEIELVASRLRIAQNKEKLKVRSNKKLAAFKKPIVGNFEMAGSSWMHNRGK